MLYWSIRSGDLRKLGSSYRRLVNGLEESLGKKEGLGEVQEEVIPNICPGLPRTFLG